jgi:signal transduction histidine kinase
VKAEELRRIELLRNLSDERLAGLAEHGRETRLAIGEFLFHEGDTAEHFSLLLEGELETTKHVGADELVMTRHEPGGYLGAIALLTETPYRASTRAVAPSRLYLLEPEDFHRLVLEEPSVRKSVFGVFAPVMQGLQGLVGDREKLVALGRLAAGLAHELNNPAAAAARATRELGETIRARDAALLELASSGVEPAALERLLTLAQEAADETLPAPALDPLEQSDREGRLAAALEARGIDDPHWLAASLVATDLDEAWVDRLSEAVGPRHAAHALAWASGSLSLPSLLATLEESTSRMSQLVGAVKQYSYMDQASRQEVDVHEGIENTLTILAHKLKRGEVEIVRAYDPDLPRIDAYGSDLNQVWTNLLDNAIDAVDGRGRIQIRTGRSDERVVVEIADDGPGIPEEVQQRIFEPFFTTKPLGIGTGLGLDIAQRAVRRHHGELRVESRPGDTRFQVVLPLKAPEPR